MKIMWNSDCRIHEIHWNTACTPVRLLPAPASAGQWRRQTIWPTKANVSGPLQESVANPDVDSLVRDSGGQKEHLYPEYLCF